MIGGLAHIKRSALAAKLTIGEQIANHYLSLASAANTGPMLRGGGPSQWGHSCVIDGETVPATITAQKRKALKIESVGCGEVIKT